MQDARRHAEKKRKIVGLYTMSTMVNYEGAVEKMNAVLMRKFREFAETKRLVQLPAFLRYYAFDVIGYITVCLLRKFQSEHMALTTLQMDRNF